jgi:2-phospho-L-lactate guanylyltransferase
MMSWTAIVPVKPPALGKTRLAGRFAPDDRGRLSDALLAHVLAVLDATPDIADIALLCETPPMSWTGQWIADPGDGLNAGLAHAASRVAGPLLVIHADLPALRAEDVSALLDAADETAAIAPDRHRTGTNALAIPDARQSRFAFGPDSFRLHCDLYRQVEIVDRPGLSHDLDMPEDFTALLDLPLAPAIRDLISTLPA